MNFRKLGLSSIEESNHSSLLANDQGIALVTVVILSAVIFTAVLMLVNQAKLSIDRRGMRNLRILRDHEFTSEMKFILSQANCGIEDLRFGGLTPSGGVFSTSAASYPIALGITGPSLGTTNNVLRAGSQYLALKIDAISIGPFNPKLYKDMYDPSSQEGQAFKSVSGMSVGYVAKGGGNYLASLSIIASSKYNQSSTPMLTSFPVLVQIENNNIVSCRSLNFLALTMSLCDELAGNFDEENMLCELPSSNSIGNSMICKVNDDCDVDIQYQM
jgi:hypothetical protein